MKKLSEKRREELRELFEKIQGERYVRELEQQPLCGSFEWVGYMI